jgi:hypothetical protein
MSETFQFPRMLRIRQVFPQTPSLNIPSEIRTSFAASGLPVRIRRGQRIAVAVGSRGVTNLQSIVQTVINLLRDAGASPFIIPAMGSHGGATPEGQRDILAGYGITEQSCGVPVHPSLEVQPIGLTPEGVEIFCADEALGSEGVFLINRIKPHTDFVGNMGSGVMKMMVIGLGKRKGAAAFHIGAMRHGYEPMLRAAFRLVNQKAPILGGLGIVENQFHQTAMVQVIPRENIEEVENSLFKDARALMPKLPFEDIDLLIVDQIGKNISGSGMDPNVIGRWVHGYFTRFQSMTEKPVIRRIFVRDLTSETHGNGIGIGLADATTARLVRGLDLRVTAINALTSLTPNCAKIPIHFETDRETLSHLLPTLGLENFVKARVVRIANTLELSEIQVSEAFIPEMTERPELNILSSSDEMRFGEDGNLLPS